MTDQPVIRTSNSNDDYLQKLRDAHPMECYRKALQKIASKRYGCCGADRIAQEALGNEATGNETGEPSPGLLMSMAIRMDHGLGVPGYYDQPMFGNSGPTHRQRLDAALTTARQMWEEVAGKGFYRPEKEAHYARCSQKALPPRPNVFTHGLTLSKADVDDICGTGDLYGGKALLACGCIDICTNQRDHMPPAQSEKAR